MDVQQMFSSFVKFMNEQQQLNPQVRGLPKASEALGAVAASEDIIEPFSEQVPLQSKSEASAQGVEEEAELSVSKKKEAKLEGEEKVALYLSTSKKYNQEKRKFRVSSSKYM